MEEEGREHEPRKRKERRDKGLVMITRRDQYCIAWIAEQYGVRRDQLQRLLAWNSGKKEVSEITVRDQLERWRRAGWIESRRMLADELGYAWTTRKGLAMVDLDDIYTAKEPASTRLGHIYAVNEIRLELEKKYA